MVSNREDLQSDCKTVNAIVSGLTPGGTGNAGFSSGGCCSSDESFERRADRRRSSASKIPSSPALSPTHILLPRPHSENNFTSATASVAAAAAAAAAFGAPSDATAFPAMQLLADAPGSRKAETVDNQSSL